MRRRISTSGGQEAFFEGHVHAFRMLGGVPFGKVRYDNLNAAVAQVIGFAVCAWKRTGGRPSDPTMTWMFSIASRDSRGLMKRAVWRDRSGGSVATTLCPCHR